MMDISITQYIYQLKHLVVINGNAYVSVYKCEKFKFDQSFLCFQVKIIFLVNQKFVG